MSLFNTNKNKDKKKGSPTTGNKSPIPTKGKSNNKSAAKATRVAGRAQHDHVRARAGDERQVVAQHDFAERVGRGALRCSAANAAGDNGRGRHAKRIRQELSPARNCGRHAVYINECGYSAARRAAAERSVAVIVSRYVMPSHASP